MKLEYQLMLQALTVLRNTNKLIPLYISQCKRFISSSGRRSGDQLIGVFAYRSRVVDVHDALMRVL